MSIEIGLDLTPCLTRSRIGSVTDGDKIPTEYLRKIGRKGGLSGGPARANALTAEERSQIAKKAAAARWMRKKKKKPPKRA